jgi:hypothetical protein
MRVLARRQRIRRFRVPANEEKLSWSCALFIVALGFIVAPQLLYTDLVVVEILTAPQIRGFQERTLKLAVALFAWASLGFQKAAIFLLAESLHLFSSGPVRLARYGTATAMAVVAIVFLIGVTSRPHGKKRVSGRLLFNQQETTRKP